ncbi:MAG: helix-turn-helix domain-containing protein [Alphaproteobacteria bacterium]
MTLPAQLVSQLRQRRRRLGLRQKDLAARIGVNKSALGRWERRKAEPSLAGVCAWAQELGFDIVLSAQRAEGELLSSNQKSGQKIGQPHQAVARRRAVTA